MIHRTAVLLLACAGTTLALAAPMSKDAYKAQQKHIEAEYTAAKARCKTLEGNARDVCKERVRGERDIALAELDMQVKPTAKNDEKLRLAKAEAAYAVAMQQCEPLKSLAQEICRKDAKAVLAGAKAEAKLQSEAMADNLRATETVRARTEAEEREKAIRFAAARERCGMLPGAQRSECLLNAQERFGPM